MIVVFSQLMPRLCPFDALENFVIVHGIVISIFVCFKVKAYVLLNGRSPWHIPRSKVVQGAITNGVKTRLTPFQLCSLPTTSY